MRLNSRTGVGESRTGPSGQAANPRNVRCDLSRTTKVGDGPWKHRGVHGTDADDQAGLSSRDGAGPVCVTVVTVTYNDLARLRATAESVLVQAGAWEWLVVDGGSTDGTVAWLTTLDDQRVRFVSEPDQGIYDAMNKGLALAAGEYVNFLNAGDAYLRPGVLRDVEERARHGYWEWGHGCNIVVDDGGRQVRPAASGYPGRLRYALGPGRLVHQAVFARADIMRELGGFDLQYPIAADRHLVMRLGRRSDPLEWPDIDVAYEQGGVSDDARRSLQDLHRARVDVYGLGRAGSLADSAWSEGMIAYVRSRRTLKRSARRLLGERSIDWWARRRAT